MNEARKGPFNSSDLDNPKDMSKFIESVTELFGEEEMMRFLRATANLAQELNIDPGKLAEVQLGFDEEGRKYLGELTEDFMRG